METRQSVYFISKLGSAQESDDCDASAKKWMLSEYSYKGAITPHCGPSDMAACIFFVAVPACIISGILARGCFAPTMPGVLSCD